MRLETTILKNLIYNEEYTRKVLPFLSVNYFQEREDKILMVNERITSLKSELGDVLLEYNYLSSPDKLTQYQTQYFEKDLIKIDITKIKKLVEKNNHIKISDFIVRANDER